MLNTVLFYIVGVFTIAMAGITALSQNIIRSAFALLGALVGVAAMFGMMGADFLAVIQIMIYVGGVMVLILFAVMLTHRISDVNVSNQSLPPLPGAVISITTLGLLLYGIWRGLPYEMVPVTGKMTARIGEALVGSHVLPFLLAGVLLLGSLVGAVVIARRHELPVRESPLKGLEDNR